MRKAALVALCLFACTSATSQATLVFNETFTYADGSLVTNSGGNWTTHSGTAGQVDVASGLVNLTQAESEDVNRAFTAITTGNIYAGTTFSFSALPTGGTGNYFFHYKDSGTSNFRGRIFATTTGAAAGTLRLGLANVAGAPNVIIPVDLSLSSTHRFVLKIDAATGISTLFLDAATETGGLTAADAVTALSISSVALRQSTASSLGMGVLTLDDIIVATTFDETLVSAVPEAPALAFGSVICGVVGLTLGGRKLRRRAA